MKPYGIGWIQKNDRRYKGRLAFCVYGLDSYCVIEGGNHRRYTANMTGFPTHCYQGIPLSFNLVYKKGFKPQAINVSKEE